MAGDYSNAEGQDQGAGEQTGSGRDDTFFLPKSWAEAGSLEVGDVITLKVLGKDKDGDVEVERVNDDDESGESNDDPMAGFDAAMK